MQQYKIRLYTDSDELTSREFIVFLNGLSSDTVFGNSLRIRMSEDKNLTSSERKIKKQWRSRQIKKEKTNGNLKTELDLLNTLKKVGEINGKRDR